MLRNKKVFITTIIFFMFFLINITNNYPYSSNFPNNKAKIDDLVISNSFDSILFDNFYYEWHSYVNGNPFIYYNGIENYTYVGGNIYQCNETTQYGLASPEYDYRDVNNQTRYFPTSSFWGDNGHDWVWVFRNITLNTKNIPIAIFSSLEPEHIFNVTGDTSVNLNDTYYNVWILEDDQGSIAYYEKSTGILIKGLFYFSGSNTWEINMTDTNALIPTNDYAPKLEDPSLSPNFGNLTTSFNYAINYSDPDNNKPISIGVIINDNYYPMLKQNPNDINYIDGVIYEYQTFLLNGTYNYYFNTSDGRFSVSTSLYSGPTVYYNNSFAPLLSDSSVYPLLGYNGSTTFYYRVNYSDADNNAPIFVNITINGNIFSMEKENLNDFNFMNGAYYYFSTLLSEPGNYVYNFSTNDGENIINLPTSGYYYNPNVTSHNLDEIDIGWIILHGEDSNSTYSTFLNDAISLGATSEEFNSVIDPYLVYPYELLIIEEGGDPWLESELINLRYWLENGGSLIIIGDSMGDAQISVSNMFNVIYNPQLGNIGTSSQIYQPNYLTVDVNSLNFNSPYTTIDISNSNPNLQIIANTSNGYPQIALLELGAGKVLWIIDEIVENSQILDDDNQIFGLNTLRWMSEKKINHYSPSFSDPNFTPLIGNSTTFFTFTVNYSDPDNRGPIYINVTLNGKPYQMIKQNPSDFNYIDGVNFEFTTTLQNGTYQYYFNASDGINEISTSILPGPSINYVNDFSPTLTLGRVNPEIGYDYQSFTFTVNYSDADNNEPKYVFVIIDDNPFLMEKEITSDHNYMDGVIYEFRTLLNAGSHQYYFNASDEERSVSTGVNIGPTVFESPLKNKKIAWIITHGETSYGAYSTLINDLTFMGAMVELFSQEINNTALGNYDILIVDEGGSGWAQNELESLESWIINGNSILILGDNADSAQISVSNQFGIYYSSQPGLSGYTSNIFHPHEATVGVSTIYLPGPLNSISSGSNLYLTKLVEDNNGIPIVGALQYGSGKLLWIVDDCLVDLYIDEMDNNLLINNSWIWLANTSINLNPPSINSVSVNPATGTTLTIFNFYLNYSDPDGSAPINVTLTIDDVVYIMYKHDLSDFNFIDKTLYNYSIQLDAGTHYYYFNVSDGMFTIGYPIGYFELKVSPAGGGGDFFFIFIIISVSSVGVAAVVTSFIVIQRKRAKSKELIDRIVDDIQKKKKS